MPTDTPNNFMRRSGRFLAVYFTGPTLLLFAGCGFYGSDSKSESTVTKEPPAVTITAEPVTLQTVQRSIEAVGTLHGFEEVAISAKVSGRVRKIAHDVGDRVQPGEVLLEIDQIDYELTAKQVEKALQVELSKLGLKSPPTGEFNILELPAVEQAQARFENAEHHLNTTRDLIARKAVSQDELTDRQMAERVARADFDGQVLMAQAGLATVQMRQEDLAIARQQLADTIVRAPIPTNPLPNSDKAQLEYAVTARRVAEGTYVPMGTELFRLVMDEWLKLRVPVPERYTGSIKEGQQVDVTVAAYDRTFAGQVVRINPAVDPATRTFEVWVLVPNKDRPLKPGSFARAAIKTNVDKEATTVPLESIVTFAGVTKIFMVVDGKAREVQVVPGAQGKTWTEITGHKIPAGTMVVTSGQSVLADGSAVKIREHIAATAEKTKSTPSAESPPDEPTTLADPADTGEAVNASHESKETGVKDEPNAEANP